MLRKHEAHLHVIISAGRSCFTKCSGCYNFFGKYPEPTKTEIILGFLKVLSKNGIEKVTIGGGDPLSRKDIIFLLSGIKRLGFKINLDTVGTVFIGQAHTIFYGFGIVEKVNPYAIKPFVDLLGIPIDGSNTKIASRFRTGRENLINEQKQILSALEAVDIPVVINTVVTRFNHEDMINIFDIIHQYANVVMWQLFQFMPIGPLGYRNRREFIIDDPSFQKCVKRVMTYTDSIQTSIKIVAKSCASRKGLYLLIDSDGLAWVPQASKFESWEHEYDMNAGRYIIGNINNPEEWESIMEVALGLKE